MICCCYIIWKIGVCYIFYYVRKKSWREFNIFNILRYKDDCIAGYFEDNLSNNFLSIKDICFL